MTITITSWHVMCLSTSHQRSTVKLEDDVVEEDQQMGGFAFQQLDTVEMTALIIHCLKLKRRTEYKEQF